jgi:hypothetical protein
VPQPASLSITNSVRAPAGSPQASTKVAVGGSCPGGFAAGPLGAGESATVSAPGAAAGQACAVAETAPPGDGGSWEVVAVVDGGAPLTLAERDGSFTIPTFVLGPGVNTVDLRNSWTPPNPAGPAPSEGAAAAQSASPPATVKHPRAKHRRHKHRRHHRHHRRRGAAHRLPGGHGTGAQRVVAERANGH